MVGLAVSETTTGDKALELQRNPADEVDPELLALPDPPRGERRMTMLLLAVTALASVAMVIALLRDAAYAFAARGAVDLGELKTAPRSDLVPNTYVRAHGMLGAAGALRFERPFVEDSFRVAPVAGRADIYVEVRVPMGEENARYVPPTDFQGRLVPFDSVGPKHRGLKSAIGERTGSAVPAGAWLVVDGESPDHARWAVALVVLFLGFAMWNVAMLAKLARKVKS
jgi:hypothetical protein